MIPFLLALTTPALADYVSPPPNAMIETATSIVDATVVGFDGDGHAQLEVHQVLAGAPVREIEAVTYSCFGGISVQMYGVAAGGRYVFLLDDANMYEETTFFEVKGDLDVEFWVPGKNRWEREWQDMNAIRARIQTLRASD